MSLSKESRDFSLAEKIRQWPRQKPAPEIQRSVRLKRTLCPFTRSIPERPSLIIGSQYLKPTDINIPTGPTIAQIFLTIIVIILILSTHQILITRVCQLLVDETRHHRFGAEDTVQYNTYNHYTVNITGIDIANIHVSYSNRTLE